VELHYVVIASSVFLLLQLTQPLILQEHALSHTGDTITLLRPPVTNSGEIPVYVFQRT